MWKKPIFTAWKKGKQEKRLKRIDVHSNKRFFRYSFVKFFNFCALSWVTKKCQLFIWMFFASFPLFLHKECSKMSNDLHDSIIATEVKKSIAKFEVSLQQKERHQRGKSCSFYSWSQPKNKIYPNSNYKSIKSLAEHTWSILISQNWQSIYPKLVNQSILSLQRTKIDYRLTLKLRPTHKNFGSILLRPQCFLWPPVTKVVKNCG